MQCIENMCFCDSDNCYDCNSTTHDCYQKCKQENCEECDGEGHCDSKCDDFYESCCDGECYDNLLQGCCNGQVYFLLTQCCIDGTVQTKCGEECCTADEMCCEDHCCPQGTTCEFTLLSQPDNPDAQLQLGWFNFSQGKWQDSISYFEKGLSKLPKSSSKPSNVLYALARMYEKTGDKIKAADTYWQLLSLMEDGDPQVQKVESRIISLDNEGKEISQ